MLATNVRTGKTRAEPVAAVLVHHDTNLYNLTIRTGRRTVTIHTTSNHPFYDLYLDRWIPANHLKTGERLKTANGGTATVLGGSVSSDSSGWMWDLTVQRNHDFYVDVIHTAVLVHNCPSQRTPLPMWRQCIVSVLTLVHLWSGG